MEVEFLAGRMPSQNKDFISHPPLQLGVATQFLSSGV